jgi:hypothetical protein
MKSSIAGKNISKAEITNLSAHGIWLLVHNKEYFLPYNTFPGFKDAIISDVLNVKNEHEQYVFWPSLGIDLELDSIENPKMYPLRYK